IGWRRSPFPPASTIASTRLVGTGNRPLLLAIRVLSLVVLRVLGGSRARLLERLGPLPRRGARGARPGRRAPPALLAGRARQPLLGALRATAALQRLVVEAGRVAPLAPQLRVVQDQDPAPVLDARRDLRLVLRRRAGRHAHRKVGGAVVDDEGGGGHRQHV